MVTARPWKEATPVISRRGFLLPVMSAGVHVPFNFSSRGTVAGRPAVENHVSYALFHRMNIWVLPLPNNPQALFSRLRTVEKIRQPSLPHHRLLLNVTRSIIDCVLETFWEIACPSTSLRGMFFQNISSDSTSGLRICGIPILPIIRHSGQANLIQDEEIRTTWK